MLYTITQLSDNPNYTKPLKLTGKGFQFSFNLKNLMYFEEDALMDNQDVILTPYIPSTEEQAQLLKEYTDWCTQFSQEQNETLITILSDITYWKQYFIKVLGEYAAKYEENLNKDMYFTSSLGFRCNGDRRSNENVRGLIDTYDLAPNNSNPVSYKDYDNQFHQLTKEQLQTLLNEGLFNGNSLYHQRWEKEVAINAADSLDTLKSLELTFKMQDFSENALSERSLADTSQQKQSQQSKNINTLQSILKLK